jgi:hypothetical protein
MSCLLNVAAKITLEERLNSEASQLTNQRFMSAVILLETITLTLICSFSRLDVGIILLGQSRYELSYSEHTDHA